MPNAPKENNEHDSFQVPPIKCDAGDEQEQRRDDEAPTETVEQGAVPIGPNHPRQMMAHRTESGDKQVNVLCAPARLRESENRKQEQRCSDVEDEITPAIEYPKVRPRARHRQCRHGLWSGKSADVLHGGSG